jgi:glutathione S-transferase
MTDELIFYTNPQSRGRIIRWMLEEIGQPYRTEVIEYAAMKSPSYLAVNPMGKVPAIKHGDTVITESAAICAYLADAFPQAGLAPAVTEKARGTYYRWLFFGAGCIEPASWIKALNVDVAPERQRMLGYGSMGDVLKALNLAIANGPYILGDKFSAADVYVGSQIGWGLQFGTFETTPAFAAYFERLSERPAFKRAKNTDDGLVAAQAG